MRLIKQYHPPSPGELDELKRGLKYTGEQMAALAGVSSDSQWRKYTGGENPRAISQHILFYISAQLVMEEKELTAILEKMRELGARID